MNALMKLMKTTCAIWLCGAVLIGSAGAAPATAAAPATVATPATAESVSSSPSPGKLSGPDPSTVAGSPSGPALTGEQLEEATKKTASKIRCPVCQGLSVEASPSEVARAMREEIKTLVAMGYDEEQVSLYFEASYGEFVRLEPKTGGFSLWVWVLPPSFLLIGAGIVWMSIGTGKKQMAGAATDDKAVASAGGMAASDGAAGGDGLDGDLSLWLSKARRESRKDD